MSGYIKIPENEYKHLLFSARGQYAAILNVFRGYGMDVFVDQAIEECMRITENFGQAVRGDDTPIHIYKERRERILE